MKISVIIPALNEEDVVVRTIRCVKENSSGMVGEIIIVDGGSDDQTAERAEHEGATVIASDKKGRSRQMNRGARHASCNILYFLHADTLPPANFDCKIKKSIKDNYSAGCFRLAFDRDHPMLNFYSWCTRFNIDAFRFGDQSLYIEKQLFKQLGGFDEKLIVMEDNEMVCRIKSRESFNIIADNVVTSARKYQRVGTIRLQLIFLLIYSLFYAGCSQEKLVSTYKKLINR
ncbi:MAG: TIGR04283 family arsenosugar biosynthesis glycosyltransferase [Balneolaceae bacterium]|nr:TIGR04283 family arsenosugar biosynthesis glycosyltransferase [Balneolaceae bacterium]